MKIIESESMPKPGGHYSMCVEHNGTLYISGQLPFEANRKTIPSGIEAQTKQVLENLNRVLSAAGTNRNKVLMVRIYMADMNDWDIINRIYAEFFGNHKPARLAVPVGVLHYGALIEIEATVALEI